MPVEEFVLDWVEKDPRVSSCQIVEKQEGRDTNCRRTLEGIRYDYHSSHFSCIQALEEPNFQLG